MAGLSHDEIPADKQTLFGRLLSSADRGWQWPSQPAGVRRRAESRRPKRAADQKLPADFGSLPEPAAVEQMFRRLDRNQDGKIVADEVPDEQRPRFDRLATMADKDHDGAITQEELRQGFDRIRQQFAGKPGEMDPARVFEYLDRNADGKLTADEIPSERKSMFERAVQFGDRDADGALTEEEFTKVVIAGRHARSRQRNLPPPSCQPGSRLKVARRTDRLVATRFGS